MSARSGFLSYRTANAAVGWLVVVVLAVVAVERAVAGELLWSAMVVAVIAVALVPPVMAGRPTEMLSWEVLVLSALPAILGLFGVLGETVAYLSVAALALAIVAELDAFTGVEMTPDFTIVFVVVVTMAVAGLWTIGRYFSDAYLGTTLVADANAAMWDLVAATAIGLLAGLLFELYFHRLSPRDRIDHDLWEELR
jgi:hypothetical protein